jgi:hypothetical protein
VTGFHPWPLPASAAHGDRRRLQPERVPRKPARHQMSRPLASASTSAATRADDLRSRETPVQPGGPVTRPHVRSPSPSSSAIAERFEPAGFYRYVMKPAAVRAGLPAARQPGRQPNGLRQLPRVGDRGGHQLLGETDARPPARTPLPPHPPVAWRPQVPQPGRPPQHETADPVGSRPSRHPGAHGPATRPPVDLSTRGPAPHPALSGRARGAANCRRGLGSDGRPYTTTEYRIRPPGMWRLRPTWFGWTCVLRLRSRSNPGRCDQGRRPAGALMGAHAVRVTQWRLGRVRVTVNRRDPLVAVAVTAQDGELLRVRIGRLDAGRPWVIDLRTVPHWLIAGATQSGKSVSSTLTPIVLGALPGGSRSRIRSGSLSEGSWPSRRAVPACRERWARASAACWSLFRTVGDTRDLAKPLQ